jgi:peptide/nickel transport system permease protein
MLGSAFVVEKVFAWPGMARFGADAIIANDFNGIVGVTLVISLAFVAVNLAIDILYEVLDPRIRVKR